MVKSSFTAPLYVSTSWVLIMTHQVFTETAILTVMEKLQTPLSNYATFPWPSVDILVFIYSFAWVFILSSVIPSIILGKKRGVFIQFLLVLTITFVSSYIPTVIANLNIIQVNKIFEFSKIFQDHIFAAIYLLFPFMLMILIDLRGRMGSTGKESELKE